MCGIAGILQGDGGPADEQRLRLMTGALAARGPDGEGFHVAAPIGLGHRRLAIIDVHGGAQPLFGEDRNVVCVINGEIYNFVELKRRLEAHGHHFATRSDSEVVVHGYEQWGDGVFELLEGMFAIAIWDAKERVLLLARDRMGEKPLYWAALPNRGLAFSSELKAMRHVVDARLDPAALARYLVYEYVPAPASIFRGVHKLEPGTCLRVECGQSPTIRRYWNLGFLPRIHDEHEAIERLRTELSRAVRERLVSDVPLGVFLSGGLDSSTVAVLAAEARGALDTFSLGFDDPSYDETSFALRVARIIGSRHHEERVTGKQVLELLPSIGRLLDEPLGDGSIVPTHLLARFARKHVTVALGGDGGDELFFGYPTFQAERAAALLDRTPRFLRNALIGTGLAAAHALPVSTSYFSLDFKLKQFLKGSRHQGAARHQLWLASFLPDQAMRLLAPELAAEAGGDLLDVVSQRLASCNSDDRWDRLQYFYAKGYLGDDVLAKVDRATMAVGLEARAPLLDSRVVGLACRIAPELRLSALTPKYVLKKAMTDRLPKEILARKKKGFAMPIGRWLKHELRPLLEEDLSEARLERDGLFNAAPIRQLVNEHVGGKADHRKPLWTLIAFQRWWQAWQEL